MQLVRTIRMQTSLLLGTCVLVLFVSDQSLILAQKIPPAPASSPPSKTSDVEKTIRENAQRFVDAFNKGDAKLVAALWTEDGSYVDETGERTNGREAIQKKYTAFFAENRAAKIEVAIDAVHQVSPDTVIEDGHSKVTFNAQTASAATGRYMVVHVKRDGKWLMASVRDMPAERSSDHDQLADLGWLIGAWHAEHLGVEMTIDCRWLADQSFVEATYSKQVGDKVVPTATQIIGVDPRSGRITSWMFNADKGIAHGVWIPQNTGWAIEFAGVSADGTSSTAVNMLGRVKDGARLEVDESNHRRQVRGRCRRSRAQAKVANSRSRFVPARTRGPLTSKPKSAKEIKS